MDKTDPKHIESDLPLSQSLLWQLQRNYFKTKGVKAWEKDVPFYISTNAFIGHRYALLVFNIMQDWIAKHGAPKGPFTLLELGAGSGKFSFHFLKAMEDIQKTHSQNISYQYIISDVAQKNIDYCKKNEQLKPFIEEKRVDFALVDVENPEDFNCQLSNKKFSKTLSKAPCIVLANYTFDCIRQDAFEIKDETLSLLHVKITSRFKDYDIERSEYLRDLTLSYKPKPLSKAKESPHYYDDPFLQKLLNEYFESFQKEEMALMIPTGAIHYFQFMQKLCKNNLFILTGDKGIALKKQLPLLKPGNIHSFDGCFSFMVNFHALGEYVKHQKGSVFSTQNSNDFKVSLFSFEEKQETLKKTNAFFEEVFTQTSPDEFCCLSEEVRLNCFRFTLKGILSFLRFSYWDPDVYCAIHDRLMLLFPKLTEQMTENLLNDLKKVEENTYDYKTSGDTYNLLGIIYQMMDKPKKAIELYQKSLKAFGDNTPAFHNLGLTYDNLGNDEKAITYLQKALKRDKSDSRAKRRLRILTGKGYLNLMAPLTKMAFVTVSVIVIIYAMLIF